jgi:hypothetical protein
MDENQLPKHSNLSGVGDSATPSSSLAQTWQAANSLLARHFRRHFLCVANRLPLALLTSRFPAVANDVLPFPALAPQRHLDALAAGASAGRAPAGREGTRIEVAPSYMPRRVKTVEESAGICGYDAHKHVKGRKRHLLVDTDAASRFRSTSLLPIRTTPKGPGVCSQDSRSSCLA